MAITPTPNNSLFKGFVFDGVDSRDYGVYISGDAVFNAPERDVEMIEIPGRNGAFALDKGRFSNIEVAYPAGLFGATEADFATGINALRNALASRKGYCRLEDDYNPNEYRMAVYKSGLDVTPAMLKAGQFDIVFECKPQRFLKSGEIPRTIGGSVTNTQTESGTVVSIDSDGGDKATSLIATIEAVQTGSGDPSPTNVRAITGWAQANVFDTDKNLVDESTAIGFNAAVTVDGGYISVTKNNASNYPAAHIDVYLRSGVTYTVSATCVQATPQAKLAIRDVAPSNTTVINVAYSADGQRKSVTYTPTKSGTYRIALFSSFGADDSSTAVFTGIQCEVGSTATAYEPYTGTTTTTALGRTVYGGTVDVVTGTLTLTHKAEIFDGTKSWGREASGTFYVNLNNASKMVGRKSGGLGSEMLCNWLKPTNTGTDNIVWVGSSGSYLNAKCSSASDAAAFKSMLAATPLVVVYPLETPQTYNLTTHEVELLAGQNNVWADTGDISITYGHDPNKLVNPTLFESHPLLKADGYGAININGEEMSITLEPLGDTMLYPETTIGGALNPRSFQVDSNKWRTGDTITVRTDGNGTRVDFTVKAEGAWINDYSVDETPTARITVRETKSNNKVVRIDIATFPEPWTFTAGTPGSRVQRVSVSGTYGDSTPFNIILLYTLSYDGDSTFTVSNGVTNDTAAITYTRSITVGQINVMSTKTTFGHSVYIDLDIGEAYYIDGGSVISLNNTVAIPAELPTLKPGANTITFDNTVDELDIVPRWWEV